MFRALLAHPQEALNKRHLAYMRESTWYNACVLCLLAATRAGVKLVPVPLQTW
jgi:hypothetical protein